MAVSGNMKLINPLLLLGHLLCPSPPHPPIHSLSRSLASSLPLSLSLSLSLLCWLTWWETQALTAFKLYSLRAVVIGGRWRNPPGTQAKDPRVCLWWHGSDAHGRQLAWKEVCSVV